MLTYNQNGTSRGIASIIFAKPDTAHKAAKELNGLLVDGRPMKVSRFRFRAVTCLSDNRQRLRSSTMPPTPPPFLLPSLLPSALLRSLSRSPPLPRRLPRARVRPTPTTRTPPVATPTVAPARAATPAAASPRLSRSSMLRWSTISPTRTLPLRATPLSTALLLRLPTLARTSAWPRFLYVPHHLMHLSGSFANVSSVTNFLNRRCLASPQLLPGVTWKYGFFLGGF